MARPGGKGKPKSKTHSLDDLSVMAGERWAREDAAKKLHGEEQADVPREPRRARPHHGGMKPRGRDNTSLGGEHT